MAKTFQEKLQAIIDTTTCNPFVNIAQEDRSQIIPSHLQAFPTSIRLNPQKLVPELATSQSVLWSPLSYYLAERPIFTLDPLLHAGAYYVQEASSMFIGAAFGYLKSLLPQHPIKVLDLCAAPGGKSTLLASYLGEDDLLVSNEVIQARNNILVENITKWGYANTWVTQNDPKDIGKLGANFDVLLIDAPCTGSGLWRRSQEAIDEWSAQHVKLCAERQKRIIADSFDALKTDGYLMYATCSYSPEENEEVMDWILQNLDVEPLAIPLLPDWNIVKGFSQNGHAEGYHFYPWRLDGEGFFLTVFKKKSEAIVEKNKKEKKKQPTPNQSFRASPLWETYVKGTWQYRKIQDTVFGFLPQQADFFDYLKSNLYIKKAGLKFGQETAKEVLPDHELALSIYLKDTIAGIDVGLEDALQYLKKESICTDKQLKGWQLVRYKGLGLGWGKWMPNRMNNYLPKNWRIRMDVK